MAAIRILSSSGRPSRSPSMLLSMAAASTDPAPKQPPQILANLTNSSLKLVESRDPHREMQVRRRIKRTYLADDDVPNPTPGRAEASPAAGAGDGVRSERTER